MKQPTMKSDMEFFVRYKIIHERFESVPLGADLQIIHNIVNTALRNSTKQEIKYAHCNLIITRLFIAQQIRLWNGQGLSPTAYTSCA